MKDKILKLLEENSIPHNTIKWLFKNNSGCHLQYPTLKSREIRVIRTKLESLESRGKPIFNVSGNGWGTGICLMLK